MRRILTILLCLTAGGLWGQIAPDLHQRYNIKRPPLRVFLNKFSISLAPGYSRTYYSHKLDGFYFYQDADGQYIWPKEGTDPASLPLTTGFTNWLNDPRQDTLKGADCFWMQIQFD